MFRLLASAALSLCALLSGPSSAVTLQATYTGIITSGWDEGGLFGSAMTDLTGQNYLLRFRYDTSLGVRDTQSSYDLLYGGTGYGKASPMISAVLTIGGMSQTILGDWVGYLYAQDDNALGSTGVYENHQAQDFIQDPLTGSYTFNYVSDAAYDPANTSFMGLGAPHTVSNATGSTSGIFQFQTYDATNGISTVNSYGNLLSTGVTVAPIPLPAGLGLLALGLAVLGAASRSRRGKVSAI